MNFNLLKDIELLLKEQEGSCDEPPARGRMGVAPLEKGLSPQRLGFKINGFHAKKYIDKFSD